MKILIKIYGLLVTICEKFLSHLFLLAVRVTWGYQFFLTGKGKLTHIDKTTAFFSDLGIPAPKFHAILAGSTECFGGALLVIGLASRVVSIPLTVTMVVAYLTAHKDNVHSLDDFVAQAPFPFLMTALIVLFFGAGIISVDGLLEHTVFKKRKQSSNSQ